MLSIITHVGKDDGRLRRSTESGFFFSSKCMGHRMNNEMENKYRILGGVKTMYEEKEYAFLNWLDDC